MSKTIVFSELQMQGEKHLNVNLGLLKILQINFPKHEIIIHCDDLHALAIREKFKENIFLKFRTFKYSGEHELKKRYIPIKIARELFFALKLFLIAKKKSSEFIFFSSAFPFTAPFLNFFSLFFKIKTIICLHGDLGVLKIDNYKFTTWFFKEAIKYFLYKRSRFVILILLGESIKSELIRFIPDIKKGKIITIDHPYNYSNTIQSKLSSKISFANIGAGIVNKNTHYIFEIAKNFIEEIAVGKVKFELIGKVSKEVLSQKNSFVEIYTQNNFISREQFQLKIETADYFIYFFQSNSIYDLCPSGTFFDAIEYNKPIISLNNPFFKYYFEKFGEIGYLCADMREMKEVIRKILNESVHLKYDTQKNNLLKAKEMLQIDKIAESFKNQYKVILNEFGQ